MEILRNLLSAQGIPACRSIPADCCRVTRPYLTERLDFVPVSVCVGIIPYLSPACLSPERNVSVYAVPRDYHLFLRRLEQTVLPEAKKAYPGAHFALFGDRSPIDERDAAAKAGLGILGKNGLLLTENYSSFVFLFEILTDLPAECAAGPVRFCENCGKCGKACPKEAAGTDCLSALTQKKGALTEKEAAAVAAAGSVWGCDVCQTVCPHTQRALQNGTAFTQIPFFLERTRPAVTAESLADDADFSERAYNWRGKDPVARNLALINETKRNKT